MALKTCFILLTSVVSLFDTAFAQTQQAPNNPGSTVISTGTKTFIEICRAEGKTLEQCQELELKQERSKSCPDLSRRKSEAEAKALAEVSSIGSDLSSCQETAKDCATGNSEEIDGDAATTALTNSLLSSIGLQGTGNMTVGQYKRSCLGRKDFRDEKNQLDRDMKSAEEKISGIQKDVIKAQEEAERDKRKLEERLQEFQAEARREDLENNQNQRKESQDSAAQTLEARDSISKLRSSVLQAQGQMAQLIAQRTQTLSRLSNALIQANCMEALEKVRAGMKAIRAGNFNSVIKQNAEIRNRLKNQYQLCLNEALTMREAGRKQADAQIAALQNDIDSNNEKIRGMEEALKMSSTHLAQAQTERQQALTQAQQSRLSRMQSLNTEYQTVDAALRQKMAQFEQDLKTANERKNKLSNELALLGKQPSTDKSSSEIVGLCAAAIAAKEEFDKYCTTSSTTPTNGRQ